MHRRIALLDAESIAYPGSAIGTYLPTVVFPRIGTGEQMALKSTRRSGNEWTP